MSAYADFMPRARTLVELGAAIRGARLEGGFTQAELAAAARVSRGFVIELERGQKPGLELGRVLAVIRALDLDLDVVQGETASFDELLDRALGGAADG